jgi:amino acid transporter
LVSVSLVLSGTVDRLIAMAGFFYVANYCWSYISLIVLRFKRPRAERPFRVPAYPVPTLLALTASLAFLTGAVISDRTNSVYALLLLVASYPVRLLLRVGR